MRVSPSISVLFGLLLLPGIGWAAGKCERLIVTGSPDAPPYLWRDPQDTKHLIGANADLLRQAAESLGITVEFIYGGKRSQALEEVRSGRMDLLVDASLSNARLDAFDYIEPAITHNEIVVWTRAANNLLIQAPDDLRNHSGAVSQRTRLTPQFDTQIRPHLQLASVPGLAEALQKLALGEVEYVLAGRYAAMVVAQALGLGHDLHALPVVVDRPGLHLAVSVNSACNDPGLRGQLSKKMTELAVSGLADQAIKRNLDVWKSQLQQPVSNQ